MANINVDKEEVLRSLGLTEKEVRVWLSMLGLGSATATDIAKRSGTNRVTVYDVIKRLIELGVSNYVVRNNVKYFQCVEPSHLITMLEEQMRKVENILPELETIKGAIKSRPRLEMYEGKAGIKAIMDDLIETRKDVMSWSSTENIYKLLQFYVPQFIKRRIKSKIRIRLLTEKSEEGVKMMKSNDKKELRETRFIPLENITNTIYVYGDKAAILDTSEKEPVGILIENENFSKTLKILFNLMWINAEK